MIRGTQGWVGAVAVAAVVVSLVVSACRTSDDEAPPAGDEEVPAQQDEGYLGERIDEDVTREHLQAEFGAGSVRVYREGEAITTDYLPDRLNVEIDDEGRILALWMDGEGRPWEDPEDGDEENDGDREPGTNDAGDSEDVGHDAGEEERDEQDGKLSGPELTERFGGQHLGDEVSEAEIERVSHATRLRVHQAGGPVTADYVEGRVNVAVNEDGRIVSIWRDEEGYPSD